MPNCRNAFKELLFLGALSLGLLAVGGTSDLATEQYVDNKVAKEAVRANSRIDAAIAEIATKTVVTTNTVPGEIEPMEEVVTNVYPIVYSDTETNYYTKGETEQKIQDSSNIYIFKNNFMYFWLCWVFVAARAFL